MADLLGLELRWCDPADPAAALDDDVALLALTHVDFRTGAMFDMAAITAAAHDVGALVQWDLCHSAGAVPVDLVAVDADFAVGCTYKYLNGGPGSPAFVWVAARHHDDARPADHRLDGARAPVRDGARLRAGRRDRAGWPPARRRCSPCRRSRRRSTCSTASTWPTLRQVSVSLTDLFIALVDERLGDTFEVVTPRDTPCAAARSRCAHPEAYGVVQALIARGVVGDFRTPDVARFGFAPLYVTHVDVWDAVERLVAVMAADEHLHPAYAVRNVVT